MLPSGVHLRKLVVSKSVLHQTLTSVSQDRDLISSTVYLLARWDWRSHQRGEREQGDPVRRHCGQGDERPQPVFQERSGILTIQVSEVPRLA